MEEICSADLDIVCTVYLVHFVTFFQQLHNMCHKLSVSYISATCFDVYTPSLARLLLLLLLSSSNFSLLSFSLEIFTYPVI